MSRIHGMVHRLRVLWRGERYAEEQARELAFHLELERDSRSSGAAAVEDDDCAARRALGNVTYYREEVRRMTLLHWLDRFKQDGGYAIRGLRRSPGFTAIVVVTLALGFGVNGAMFSLVDTLFLRDPDGVQAPSELRRIFAKTHPAGLANRLYTSPLIQFPIARAVVRATDVRNPVGVYLRPDSARLEIDGTKFGTRASEVSASYFSVLGVRAVRGRFFAGDEDSLHAPAFVAVVSESFWKTRLGGRPDAIGKTLLFNHRPFTVIGVAGGGFRGIDLDVVDIWTPLNTHVAAQQLPTPWYDRVGTQAQLIARVASASDEARVLGVVRNALRTTVAPPMKPDAGALAQAGPIHAELAPSDGLSEVDVTKRIAIVSLFVLLIATANAINLLLLRGAQRRREMALRLALGVSRARLTMQFAGESMLLSLIAGVIAAGVAALSGTALRHLVIPEVHLSHGPVDMRTLIAIGVLCIFVGLVSGLAPARQGLRVNVIDSLRGGGHDVGYRRSRLRDGLLVLQTALCVVLVVGASLFLRSLQNARAIDVGYDVDNLTTFEPVFATHDSMQNAALSVGLPEVQRRIEHLPGVRAVGLADGPPMLSINIYRAFVPGRDSLPRTPDGIPPIMNVVSPTFFDAAGMKIVQGRGFTAQDTPDAAHAVVVSETMAQLVWPGESAVGKCLILGDRSGPCGTVVGVVSDAHRVTLVEGRSMMWYTSLAQPLWPSAPQTLVVRSADGQSARITSVIERQINATMPGLDGITVHRYADVIETRLRPWELGAVLFVAFGALSLTVAGIGVYSVAAFAVSQRTREIGVRMALGARAAEVVDLVVWEGLRTVVIGIAIGIATSFALGRLVSTILFGVTATDPSALIFGSVALCVLAMVASALPALRASRVDPAVALRSE